MRALNKGWIGIALIVLFGASLFFFRGSSRYSNLFNSDNIVASISGTPISRTVFMRSLEMNIGQFARMLGKDLSGDEIKDLIKGIKPTRDDFDNNDLNTPKKPATSVPKTGGSATAQAN